MLLLSFVCLYTVTEHGRCIDPFSLLLYDALTFVSGHLVQSSELVVAHSGPLLKLIALRLLHLILLSLSL